MAGHNKWSKVKHKKAASDAQKSKFFSKLAGLIAVESKRAEGNIESPGLRAAIERAKAANMPAVNIGRAVQRGVGKDAALLQEIIYEAYGPGGSALIVHAVTDNRNRTTAEVKHILGQRGASLAEQGAAAWAFERKEGFWTPKTTVPLSPEDGEKLTSLKRTLEEQDDVQSVSTNTSF